MPPGFTHCKSAVPPEDDKKMSVRTFPNPAALNLAVRLKSEFFLIVGVPMKCGLAAMTGAATKDAARLTASRILGIMSRGFREVILIN